MTQMFYADADSRASARIGSSHTYRSKGTSWKSMSSARKHLATPKSGTDSESIKSGDVTFEDDESDDVSILLGSLAAKLTNE